MKAPIFENVADLHEDLLIFLLKYRKQEHTDFTFLLKPDENQWREGKWFYGNERWVNIFFLKSQTNRHWDNNIELGINIYGGWNIHVNFDNISLVKDIVRLFSNIGNSNRERRNGNRETISPFINHYREGIRTCIDIIYNRIIKDKILIDNKNLSLIDTNEFEKTLEKINDYRKHQQQVSLYGFTVENYQGIKSTSLRNLPNKANWIFLTGENGFGKTSILQSIAIGLYGNIEEEIIPKDKNTNINIFYQYQNRFRNIIHLNDPKMEDFFEPVISLAAYGPSRLDPQSENSDNRKADNATATYGLFHTDGYLKNIEIELKRTKAYEEDKYKILVSIIQKAIPAIAKIEIIDKGRKVIYYEKDSSSGEIFDPVEFHQLASGIRNTINIVGDIFIRLNKMLNEFQVLNDIFYTPEELIGIVIIDELDLHLHPKWLKKLPSILSNVFPKIQFICSTHSSIPILGAPKNSVFLKVNRNKEDGVCVDRLEIIEKEIKNLLPNHILTSPLFDFEEIIALSNEEEGNISTTDSYQEYRQEESIKEKLEILKANNDFLNFMKDRD
ncbi:MAG: AAA family ATPase [Leptospiraceae bacterium]|nr:AAA family ATPase [Leptospiraceae bacterium]